ncbi:MAG TPA: PAS domain S-box protein [Syntrophales bacterium]|nr:PAS domain S-box protein [Syntrophales bacterium]
MKSRLRAMKESARRRLWFRMWFLPLTGFVLLGLLVLFDELYDLPSVLLNAQETPINWHEVFLEASIVLIIGAGFMFLLVRSINDAKRADIKTNYIQRALRAIRNVNQLIIKERDPGKLIQRACETVVETRGYTGACIMPFARSEESLACADSGTNNTFEKLIQQLKNDRPPAWVHEFASGKEILTLDDRLIPFTGDEATPHDGDQGVLAARLEHHGEIYGILLAYLPVMVMNDDEEQSLFLEMAGDIAFALHNMESEKQRRESEERFRTLFEGASEGILVADDEAKRFMYANPAICDMLGYPAEELTTLGIEDIHPKEELEKVLAELEKHTAGRSALPEPIRCIRKDGRTLLADITSSPMVMGHRKCVIGFFRDVTKKIQLEEQFRQSQRLEAVGQLAGGIAHDFNNLLTIIMGNCDLMKDAIKEDDPILENLVQIRAGGEKAASLTRQLLAYGRKQALRPVVFSINESVINLEKMLRRLIGENIQLTTALTGDLDCTKADPGQIEQIIMNLAVNSRDAMPEGGRLLIETRNVVLDDEYAEHHIGVTPGNYVMLAITDTGHGMDEETRAHIFEPFFTTKEMARGTGLGLSTVYGIVKQSGGGIWIYSEPEKGTTFKIYFPSVDGPAQTVVKSERKALWGGETVLAVEDDPAVRQLLERQLKKLGYAPTVVANGDEAIRAVREEGLKPDLLITDMIMPGMTGIVVAHHLREALPGLKVLYMSGYSPETMGMDEIFSRGTSFIQKPFNIDELSEKIREIVDTEDM